MTVLAGTSKQDDYAVHSITVSSAQTLLTVTILLGERNTITRSSTRLSDQHKLISRLLI